MKKILFIFCLVFFSLRSEAQIIHIVSNLNDSGLGSLRDKVNISNDGDVIRFDNSLIATGSATINLLSEITFSKELKFKGLYNSNDTLKISGGNTTRVFNIINCGKTIIDSMIIINGNSSGNGGAILRLNCNDTLFILNSTITDNNAFYGGGIYSKLDNDSILTSNLYVENSSISENTASINGGGVYFESSSDSSSTSIIIELSNFVGNVALNGAGVYYQSLSASTSVFSIDSSNILENVSTYNGGGVHCNFSNSSSLTISNSNIDKNIAGSNGGGINYASFYGSSPDSSNFSIIINNSTISENESYNGGGLSYSSSSLFSYQSFLTSIFNSTISNNNAANGGGVYSASSGASSDSLFLKNSTISGNTSNNGGGFFSSSNSSTASRFFSISNSTIYGNAAIDNGGGIYSNYQSSPSTITVKSSIIAENGSGVSGIYSFNSPIILSNSYNVFSNSLSGINVNDQISTALQLNLQSLSFNSGSTQTLLPGSGSVAQNNGDPTDLSDAQNGVIYGVRDIGAAEACHSASSIIENSCGSYSSPSGANTFTSSGVYSDTLVNVNGCDSILTINLTVNYSNTGDTTAVACESFDWYGTTYTSSATPTQTFINSLGCDSVVTLNLTINNSNTGTDVLTACNTYTWIDGNTYTSSNSTATHTLTTVAGCDSVVTLNLTINTVNSSVTQSGALLTANEPGATYQWLDCPAMTQINGATNQAYTATANGDYAVIVTINGCSETSTCNTVTGVGIIENDFGSGLLLYPNPTDGNFSIDLGENSQMVTVTMTDLSGKVIQSKTYSNEQLLNLKIEEPAGVYLLVIESGDKKAVIRLVKE